MTGVARPARLGCDKCARPYAQGLTLGYEETPRRSGAQEEAQCGSGAAKDRRPRPIDETRRCSGY
ncbi:MAG: hypothetical protein ACP5LD_06165 [Desulfomonilaceae bacterium]